MRLAAGAVLTAVLFLLTEEGGAQGVGVRRLALLGLLSWTILGWPIAERGPLDAFPRRRPASEACLLAAASVLLGAAAFGAGRGGRGLARGAAFGALASAAGLAASRWPGLSRAAEMSGAAFAAAVSSALLTPALAATHAASAAALLRRDEAPRRWAAALGLAVAWAAAAAAGEAFARSRGYGPRGLAEAAGVADNARARRLAVAWLFAEDGRPYRVEPRLMASETVDLSPSSIESLEAFLERSRLRGVFAAEALAAVRSGRLQWWQEERALDAAMIRLPGRVHPDYRGALELLRAGPLTAERFAKLEQLSAMTGRRVEGFESARESQLIFEGFAAAYARFGEEAKAREWLRRLDDLWAVSDKRVEAGPLEDLRDGRVDGSVVVEGGGAPPLVGLFAVWRSSASQTTHYWLSGSRAPDADGRFSFGSLGPGRYVLALLGPARQLRGLQGAPGPVEVTDERPVAALAPIRLSPTW